MMKLKRIAAILAAMTLLTGSALAGGAMTQAELAAIWQQSFDRMGTTGEVWSVGLPGDSDLSYADALQIARQAIFDKFATPAAELDAMGVYPDFYAAEGDSAASWRFYFTPMTDGNVDQDHALPAQGEYRVYLDSPSGKVTLCNWYIDDFWPYAQRAWDAGKQDVVYARARQSGFFSQSPEDQAHFLSLLADAGYDISPIRSGEALFEDTYFRLDLNFGDANRAIDPADDPRIATAWRAIEETYGLDGELMRRYAYISFYSPLNTGTRDVYIAYNYNVEWAMLESGELDYWQDLLFGFVDRLGIYLVQLDPDTDRVVNVARRDRDQTSYDGWDNETLLGTPQWGAKELTAFDAAFRKRTEVMAQAAQQAANWYDLKLISDELMLEIGGDPGHYNSRREQDTDAGLEACEAIALQAAMQAAQETEGLGEKEFTALYTLGESGYDPSRAAYEYWFYADIRVTESVYYVLVDARTGEVLEAKHSHGNG